MRVKWIEQISASQAMLIYDMFPEANSVDFDKTYEGEVVGNGDNLFIGSYFLVHCTDGEIRKAPTNKVKIIDPS